jgi:hypothetical protein
MKKAPRRRRDTPDVGISLTVQPLGTNGIHVVPECRKGCDQALGQILVNFDLHRLTGVSTSGRSS